MISTVVDPTLTFTVAGRNSACNGVNKSAGATSTGTAVSLGRVNATAPVSAAQDLTITTNSAGGFIVYISSVGEMTSGINNIAKVGGSNSGPLSLPGLGTPAFGYTTDDATLDGTVDRFTSGGTKWAPLAATNFPVSYKAISSAGPESACVGFILQVANATPAGSYSATVVYTAVPLF